MSKKLLVLLAVCLLITSCGKSSPKDHPIQIIAPDAAYITDLFVLDDTLYSLQYSGTDTFIVPMDEAAGQSDYSGIFIAGMESDYGSYPFWDEKNNGVCYVRGSSLYRYNMETGQDDLLWSLPDATKKDHIAVTCYSVDWFVIQAFLGQKNSGHDRALNPYIMKSMEYMAVNRHTGEAVFLCSVTPEDVTITGGAGTAFTRNYIADNGYYGLVVPLCVEGNTLYYLQHKTKNYSEDPLAVVLCTDLVSGETTELGEFEQKSVSQAEGCLFGDYLYFTTDHFGIWTLNLKSGEIEYCMVAVDEDGHHYHLPQEILKENDHLYLILWDDNDVSHGPITGALCEWIPETNTIAPIGDTNYVLEGAEKVCFYENVYYLFSGTTIIRGEF